MLISNSDIFDKMYQEINRQNTFYFWIIGIALTISVAITVFFGVLQWRLSDKQIQRMKEETKNEIVKEYSLEKVAKIDDLDEYQQKAKIALKNLNSYLRAELIKKIFQLIREIGNNPKIDGFQKMNEFEMNIDSFVEDPFLPKAMIGSSLTVFLTRLEAGDLKKTDEVEKMKNYIREKGADALQELDNMKNMKPDDLKNMQF
ncbi:hypothetical protein ACSKKH_04450 [Limosilactobacillus reuteri]